MTNKNELTDFITRAFREDVGDGDYSSLASVDQGRKGKARLLAKESGVLAGLRVAQEVFRVADPSLELTVLASDGDRITPGMVLMTVQGEERSILMAERLVLNIIQRMSGIATTTAEYVKKVEGTGAMIIDTRKTTPGMRFLEKEAVRIGGGTNHRMGLYDMIMLKDNHIDYAGGITAAINRTKEYLLKNGLNLKIEVESRSLNDVREILKTGGVDRIMLDNFSVPLTAEAVKIIDGRTETESSGGITLVNVRDYAECGVDFISIGALTHHIKSLDLSLKAF
ncbi:MAG TPA: carboxylating nicotinate-nucleotide diphosphorylase [Bacteroidales bacterium]|nr:carboxylating nicotinate-nucleotide diphosphorylase [Bacteroidales bacterium]HPT13133.1 carboxylating nicotinate-nucleotide diphosphorylase [Bacteroidales bacterium]